MRWIPFQTNKQVNAMTETDIKRCRKTERERSGKPAVVIVHGPDAKLSLSVASPKVQIASQLDRVQSIRFHNLSISASISVVSHPTDQSCIWSTLPRNLGSPAHTMSSDGSADSGQLSTGQQDALQTYMTVTGQEPDAAIPLLQRSQWNVQVSSKLMNTRYPS